MAEHQCTKESVFTKLFVGQESIQKDITQIKDTIEGDGNPGLMKKLEEAHNYIIAQKQKEESEVKIEKWSRKKLLFWGAIIFVILQFLLELLREYIRLKLSGG